MKKKNGGGGIGGKKGKDIILFNGRCSVCGNKNGEGTNGLEESKFGIISLFFSFFWDEK
jgi:hypothetical protein